MDVLLVNAPVFKPMRYFSWFACLSVLLILFLVFSTQVLAEEPDKGDGFVDNFEQLQKSPVSSRTYTVELSGDLIAVINNLEQRINVLEKQVKELEHQLNQIEIESENAEDSALVPVESDSFVSLPNIEQTDEQAKAEAQEASLEPEQTESRQTDVLIKDEAEAGEQAGEHLPVVQDQEAVIIPDSNEQAYLALPGDVLISEIMPNPLKGQKEWVELYNNTNHSIDLSDWILEEGAGQQTKLSQIILPKDYLAFDKSGLNNSGDIILLKSKDGKIVDQLSYGDWDDGDIIDNAPVAPKAMSLIRQQIGQDTDIDADDFVITQQPTKGFANQFVPLEEKETADTERPKTEEASSKNQQAEFFEKDDEADEGEQSTDKLEEDNKIDESEQPISESAEQWQISEGSEENNAADFESAKDKQIEFSFDVRINEILPDPQENDSQAEWIELYNFADKPINLYKWQIDDGPGGSKPFLIDTDLIIPAKGYLLLERKQTGLILNNDKDSVQLIDPQGKVISEVDYTKAKLNQSYAYFGNQWKWTKVLTPGAPNIQSADTETESGGLVVTKTGIETKQASDKSESEDSLSIAFENTNNTSSGEQKKKKSQKSTFVYAPLDKVQQLAVNTKVCVQGIVSVKPGVLGKRIFYLSGDTGGVQIYLSKLPFPELLKGQMVYICGKISQIYGEKRIKVADRKEIKILDKEQHQVPILSIQNNLLDENWLGRLVKIQGMVIDKKNQKLWLNNGKYDFLVYFKTKINIDSAVYHLANKIQVTGIVSKCREQVCVLPRSKDDITILSSSNFQQNQGGLANPLDSKKKKIVKYSFLGLFSLFSGFSYFFGKYKK